MGEIKKTRINIYLPEDLLEQIDSLAEKFMLKRSIMIQIAVKTYVDQQTMLEMSKKI